LRTTDGIVPHQSYSGTKRAKSAPAKNLGENPAEFPQAPKKTLFLKAIPLT
jgi:hypothetical protein